MRHRNAHRKFSRTSAHRVAMFRNLATALLRHERIRTTDAKAKDLRGYVERLITLSKRGDLAARRQVAMSIQDQEVLHKLFAEIGPRFKDRPGGYTRVVKIGHRRGDNAPMSQVELIGAPRIEPVVVPPAAGPASE